MSAALGSGGLLILSPPAAMSGHAKRHANPDKSTPEYAQGDTFFCRCVNAQGLNDDHAGYSVDIVEHHIQIGPQLFFLLIRVADRRVVNLSS